MRDKLHKITIRDYGLFSKTGKTIGLKKYGITDDNIIELNDLVSNELNGGEAENPILEKEFDKVDSKMVILKLQALSRALLDLMTYESEIDILNSIIGKETKEKKSKYYIDKVYEITQLKIETIEDIKKINKEIERRNDKYIETFKDVVVEKGVTFMQIVFSVFRLNGFEKIDYDMVLSDFFELKNMIPKKKEDGRTE